MPNPLRSRLVTAAVAALGAACLIGAAMADRAWFEHHFLPELLHPRAGQLRALAIVRAVAAALGLALLLAAFPAGRAVRTRPLRRLALAAAPTLVAVVAAVVVAELVLDSMTWRAHEQSPPMYEPLRTWDTTFGWRQVASHTGYGVTGGRRLQYAFDVHGYRVRNQDQPVDLDRPTIVFAGESVVQGHGLTYDESAPAQVAAMTGVQTANVAVGGYATDQIYLLLKSELPKFRRPVAVVVLFMPSLFHRNMDTDRPHLTPGLVWTPVPRQPRLIELARRLVPYRSDADIAAGVTATQDELRGVVALARARGAVPLIIVPQLGPETNEERAIRRRILDAAGLPYVLAPLDAAWVLPHNRHPDAHGAAVIARAVSAYLQARGVGSDPPRGPKA